MPVVSQGLDYSATNRLSGKTIRDHGYEVVRRYLWFPGQRWPALDAQELQNLLANGLQVDAIYEQNTNDPAGGYSGGRRMATQAVASANAIGLPRGSLIYMCCDAWLSTHGIPLATAMDFYRGGAEVIRAAGFRFGAYGFADSISEAIRLGLADHYWLAGAYIPEGYRSALLTSWQSNQGYVHVGGVTSDHNDNYRHSGASAPGGGGGAGGGLVLSDEAIKQIGDLHALMFQGGPVASHVLNNGALPDPALVEHTWGYDGLAYRMLDMYAGVASVWQTNGLTMGQAFKALIEDEDNPLTDAQATKQAEVIAEKMRLNGLPDAVVQAFMEALRKGITTTLPTS